MNNILNTKMRLLAFGKITANQQLDISLQKLLLDGFVVHNYCYFLKKLFRQQNHVKESNFIDRVGYECFINSIHIDDYIENNLFEQTVLFAESLILLWNSQHNGLVLKIVLSETESGFNLKFHVERKDEIWINEDELCKFKEAIIVFNSNS